MDKMLAELEASLTDVKSAQNSMSSRIDQFTPSEKKPADCNCNQRTEEMQKEISGLRTTIEELKEKVTEDDQKQLKLSEDVKTLQIRFESIECLLTDDSKLHRAALKNKDKNTTVTSKTDKDSSVNKNKASESYTASKSNSGSIDSSSKTRVGDLEQTGTKHGSDKVPERTKYQSDNVHKTVGKPNFLSRKRPKVKQEMKLVYNGERHWRSVTQMELEASRMQCQYLEGVHSIICLDISESMCEENTWSQAQTFLTDYLTGLQEMSKLPDLKTEHVALVTFGHETKVQMRYTDRYSEVQTFIDNLKLGGPSQMHGGVFYALAAAWCSGHQMERLRNGTHIFTKVIMVTDGKPTESDLVAGPDIPDSSKIDETKAMILQEMENFQKNRFDVFVVPVGTSDRVFLNTMVTCSDGVMLNYKSGRRLARRQYLSSQLLDPLGLMTDILSRGSDNDLSQDDKEDMRDMQERAKRFMVANSENSNMYIESKNSRFPCIGSRVRRGPDWIHKLQDSNGPGTVIGHSDDGEQVWVEWDTDNHRNIYRYGIMGYDVLAVDEPRVLAPGQMIAVGCEVEPGKDWKIYEEKRDHGVVIKLDKRNKKAKVRWNDGKRGDYLYGDGGSQEIQIKSKLQKRGADGYGQSTNYRSTNSQSTNYQSTNYQSTNYHLSDVNNSPSSNFTSSSVDNSESSGFASNSVGDSRIAETIEEYAARAKLKKNKNKS